MRIALVHRDLHAITRGGICTLYRALAPRLAAAGHDLTLITQHTPHPLTMNGIRVVTLPRTNDLPTHRAAVAQVLNELRPDVVEASSWEAEPLRYAQQPWSRRAAVVVRGDLSAATMGADELVETEAVLLAQADAVLAVSEFAADDLAAAYQIPRPEVVPNGIDRTRFRPGPLTPPTSGYQVSLGPNGISVTARPLTTTVDPPPPWGDPGRGRRRLVWVGKTTPMKGWDLLERLTAGFGDLAHITVVLGHAPPLCPITLTGSEPGLTILRDLSEDDMPGLYRAADWLLSTSRWEGFGLAIGEALACGTPVLLPDHLGTAPELLAAGGGRTYRNLDQLRVHLTSQPPPGVLPAMFDWDRNAATTLAVYQRTLAARRQEVG